MAPSPYLEKLDSQIPAIQLLQALGWKYLPREEALAMRDDRRDRVILTGILRPWMGANNPIRVRSKTLSPNAATVTEAIRRLSELSDGGLLKKSADAYDLLTLGTSVDQTIDDERKGRQLRYIDWEQKDRNEFHVTDEFIVEHARSSETSRPDLVLFVNGIPFAVIECKRRDKGTSKQSAVEHGIAELLDYQGEDHIPQLFPTVQLLLSTAVNECCYGTVGTSPKFWATWSEQRLREPLVHAAANQRLPEYVVAHLFSPSDASNRDAYREAKKHFEALWKEGDRLPTAQDRTLFSMLRPERLLDYAYRGVVFDAGEKKVARHQQWFTVQETIDRVSALHGGQRRGGVVWHSTGSGKSITMLMIAKALALAKDIENPRVILVTDRDDLDKQLAATFHACGRETARARTGEELVRLIREGRATVISTIIDKFRTVFDKSVREDSPNIFVLVDEGHRTNYGETAAKMRRVFRNACYIGFTGTPLMKADKNTLTKFGGFIHTYTTREAVKDKAVVPLVYEGRHIELEPNEKALDNWFERITAHLPDDKKAAVKKKLATRNVIATTERRLQAIASDVSVHLAQHFKPRALKGQLAVQDRRSAVRYRRFFNDFAEIRCEAVMSAPDKHTEGAEPEDDRLVTGFWKEMMDRHGSEAAYMASIKDSFKRPDGIDLIICVDKLLTGFDEPRNTVLYIDKNLKEHGLLQAIARVNRVFDGKEKGFIVDYRGVLGELDTALKRYDALAAFDPEDVDLEGALESPDEVFARLPQLHSDVWEVFKQVAPTRDPERLERHLAPEDRRQAFYEALRAFEQGLAAARTLVGFWDAVSEERARAYATDVKLFQALRSSVRTRYAESVSTTEAERRLRELLDQNLQAPEVRIITPEVEIFDREAFEREVGGTSSPGAKADAIAHRLRKTCTERMDEDPAFFAKFGSLVQKAIDDYGADRISELEYLNRVQTVLEQMQTGQDSNTPAELQGASRAFPRACYGVLEEAVPALVLADERREALTALALKIEERVRPLFVVDWVRSTDAVKQVADAIEDVLIDGMNGSTSGDRAWLYEAADRVSELAKKQART